MTLFWKSPPVIVSDNILQFTKQRRKKQTRIRMRNKTHAIYYHKLGVINKGIHEYLHRPHTPVQETHNSIISKTRNTWKKRRVDHEKTITNNNNNKKDSWPFEGKIHEFQSPDNISPTASCRVFTVRITNASIRLPRDTLMRTHCFTRDIPFARLFVA